MKKALFALATIASALILSANQGCKPVEKITTVHDTVKVYEYSVVRDTLITIPADSALIEALVDCPDLEPLTSANGRVVLKVHIKDGKLRAKCDCVEKSFLLQLRDKYSSIYRSKNKERVVPVFRMNGFQKTFFWIGISLAAILLIYIIFKIVKIFI